MLIKCDRCQEIIKLPTLKVSMPSMSVACPQCGETLIIYATQILRALMKKDLFNPQPLMVTRETKTPVPTWR